MNSNTPSVQILKMCCARRHFNVYMFMGVFKSGKFWASGRHRPAPEGAALRRLWGAVPFILHGERAPTLYTLTAVVDTSIEVEWHITRGLYWNNPRWCVRSAPIQTPPQRAGRVSQINTALWQTLRRSLAHGTLFNPKLCTCNDIRRLPLPIWCPLTTKIT